MADEKSSQAPAKKSGRSWRWIYYLVVAIIIVVAVLYLTGHLPGVGGGGGKSSTTTPPPVGSGYLAITSTSVVFIQWNQTGTAASGVAQLANVGTQGAAQTVSVKTVKVTGTVTDKSVSADFEGVTEVFGTPSDKGFTLNFPQSDGSLAPVVFKQASAEDYNTALSALRAQVSGGAQGAAQTTTTT